MRQLSQRITVRCDLQPMTFEDTADYINHRLAVAGGKGAVLFTQGALKRIYRYSRASASHQCGLRPDPSGRLCPDTAKITSSIAAAGIKDLKKETSLFSMKRP